MVIGAFPLAKLGVLAMKQISKPVANYVKRKAKSSPFFREYICMPPAQFYHWSEIKFKMWSMNLGKPQKVPKLNEKNAIDLGAELLGEGIIFSIGAGLLIYEYAKSSKKEATKEEQAQREKIRLDKELKQLYIETARQQAKIEELIRILRVKLPEETFNPAEYDKEFVPEYYRRKKKEPELSSFQRLKGWIWDAVDVIIPEVEESPPLHTQPPTIQNVPVKVKRDIPEPDTTNPKSLQDPQK